MHYPLFSLPLAVEEDVVTARQKVRQLAGELGFDEQDQIRLATAVSEIARNAYSYAGGGTMQVTVEGATSPQLLVVAIRDRGKGIERLDDVLAGRYRSTTGMGLGILGSRRLVDRLEIESGSSGTAVVLKKLFPSRLPPLDGPGLSAITEALLQGRRRTALEELRDQNRELITALDSLERRREELMLLNRELEDTNRGVVALYAELDEKAEHLRHADAMKTRFLSNMTHEFRTPLNSIIALSRILESEMDGSLTAEQKKQVGYIVKSAGELSELVNDLLDLAKIEAGKTTVRPREFSVAELFSALRGMLRPLLLNQAVSLVFEEADQLPPMYSDEAKVSQILRNFVSNALKFTERGEIRVSAIWDEPDDTITFAVADTGIGIAQDDLDMIFVEFSQLDTPLQRKFKGTGLGLPLTRKLSDLLGGVVSVESQPQIGSTFRAILPRVFTAATPRTSAVVEVARDNRLPVLFVEGEMLILRDCEDQLKRRGFRPLPARELSLARQAVREIRPRAIVLDATLPTSDAWAFLAQVTGDPASRAIPVIVVSEAEGEGKARSLGAAAWHRKPVGCEWLITVLDSIVLARCILIVDDDEATRYVLRRALEGESFEVSEAPDGEEGLRQAATRRPDLIILDLQLPGISGPEVLDRLKDDPATREIPVVIYTSRPLDEFLLSRIAGQSARMLSKQEYEGDMMGGTIREILEQLRSKEDKRDSEE
jgi:signal transduction histidine kinase/DNA-binding response OmpR family regulator